MKLKNNIKDNFTVVLNTMLNDPRLDIKSIRIVNKNVEFT